jgi:hypothetical protein
MSENFNCPLCESHLSKEKWEKVTGIWKTIRKQEEEFKQKKQDLEKDIKKKEIQLKEREKKWQKEKQELKKKAEEEALKKVSGKHKKELSEATKQAKEEGRKKQKKIDEDHRKKEIKLRDKVQNLEKKLEEARKKGLTEQEMGFDYEGVLLKELKNNFESYGDIIEKKGQKGDILHTIMYKNKEAGKILYECKRTGKWQEAYVSTLKEAVLLRKVNLGILVTSIFKKGKKGFFTAGENVYVVLPEAVIDFVKVWRNGIIEINSLKIDDDEKDILMKKLLEYIDSNDFKSIINDIIDKSEELKNLLKKEWNQHKKIWQTRLKYYKQMSEGSLKVKEKVKNILQKKEKVPMVVKQKKKTRSYTE